MGGKDLIKTFVGGIIAVGLIAAVGINAKGLAKYAGQAGSSAGGLLGTAETGKA